jgi:protein-disulfide isomerase
MTSFARIAKTSLDVISAIVVVVAGVIIIRGATGAGTAGGNQQLTVEEVPAGTLLRAAQATRARGNGKIAIVEFSDYECPFCQQYAKGPYREVQQKLVSSGEVRYVFMNFPLEGMHPLARGAAEAAECARAQGRFWEMHDRLFAERDAIEPNNIRFHAEALGLDTVAFDHCLVNTKGDQVKADVSAGYKLGVRGTPYYFFGTVASNGDIRLLKKIPGAPTFDQLAEAVRLASGHGSWWTHLLSRPA